MEYAGFAFIALSILIFRIAYKMGKECRKYEFENRTYGGVVQFKDFDASV